MAENNYTAYFENIDRMIYKFSSSFENLYNSQDIQSCTDNADNV